MNKLAITVAALAIGGVAPLASAFDLGVGIDVGKPRPPVVVQPPPEVGRRWVPETVVRREEKVLVSPGRVDRREEKILVEPGRTVSREEKVLIAPERIEKRTEQVLVRPARVEKQWVPAVAGEVKVGPLAIGGTSKEGHWREVTIPPVYETVVREVIIPARYDIRVVQVPVPPRYEVKFVEVPHPPRYEVVSKDVVIPGDWEETTVVPPPVVVKPARPGFELDVDVRSRR